MTGEISIFNLFCVVEKECAGKRSSRGKGWIITFIKGEKVSVKQERRRKKV